MNKKKSLFVTILSMFLKNIIHVQYNLKDYQIIDWKNIFAEEVRKHSIWKIRKGEFRS